MDDKKISIELTVPAWNVVMNALGARPFAEVAELIMVIRSQAEPQMNTPLEPQPE